MDTIVLADAHFESLNDEVALFLRFLSTVQPKSIRILYLLGDLFTIWLGAPKLRLVHQEPIIQALRELRNQGVVVKYVEGNRDYFLSPMYLGNPFSEIASEGIEEMIGQTRLYLAHGDLVNVRDRQYRLWRSFSRNRLIYAGFNRLPRSFAVWFMNYLERTFRGTNQAHKASFPMDTCATYARHLFQKGYDTVILGHFHVERQQEFSLHGQKKSLYILPAWKDTHTYLQINDQGECSFQKFAGEA